MKQCFKCLIKKPLSEFYKHSKMLDGRLGKCKDCTKLDTRNNRYKRYDYYQAYDRERAKLPHRKKMSLVITKRQRKTIAGYMKAHNAVSRAISSGKLKRKPCQMCGTKDWVAAHHDDYKKPLDVMWLCPKHHSARHAFLEHQKS
jgi:hypothetical protein